jgi:hypothetical protein
MSSFQAASTRQGTQFAAQCDLLLQNMGFSLEGKCHAIAELGIEIDRVAREPSGGEIWFEYKGSLQGRRRSPTAHFSALCRTIRRTSSSRHIYRHLAPALRC